MPNGRHRRTSLTLGDLGRLTGDQVAEMIAYAEAKHGADSLGRRSFLKLANEYLRDSSRDLNRTDAALVRACAGGAIALGDLDGVSTLFDAAALDERLEALLASPAPRRGARRRLRLVCSRSISTRRRREGLRGELRLVQGSSRSTAPQTTDGLAPRERAAGRAVPPTLGPRP